MKTAPTPIPTPPKPQTSAITSSPDGVPCIYLTGTPRLAWWLRWLLCIGGGAFMSLAFPPVDWSGIVWVGLMPLLAALWLEESGFWRSFRAGWLYGMGMYCTSFSWICEVGKVFNIPQPLFIAIAFFPLMAFYSLLPALWAGVAGTLLYPCTTKRPDCADKPQAERKRLWGNWATADLLVTLRCAIGGGALWACIDWLRGQGTLGFSWNTLGMALYDGLSLVQWAEFVGTAALSFLPVFTAIILWCTLRRTYLHFKGTGVGCRPWDFYGAVIFIFILFAVGMVLAQNYSPAALFRKDSVMQLPVMAVQLNQDQSERIAEGRGGPVQDGMYLRETMSAFNAIQQETVARAMKHPELGIIQKLPVWVVWPESAMGHSFFLEESTLTRYPDAANANSLFGQQGLPMLRELVGQMGGQPFVLFTGTDEQLLRREGNNLRVVGMLNSMAVIPSGGFEGMLTASKQHLMPFGEYIPFAEDIEWIARGYTEVTGTQVGEGIRRGTGDSPLSVPVPGTDEFIGVIPAVCYEDTVGSLLPKFVRKGPQVIVNVSNDGWFNLSACGVQQARAAAFRCIELRRPMVRAANRGLTCAIAPNGSPIDELRKADGTPHLAGYSYGLLPVDRHAGYTLYALFGDWAIGLCALIALGFALPGLRRPAARS